jgi:hypothetical protein
MCTPKSRKSSNKPPNNVHLEDTENQEKHKMAEGKK